MVVWGLARDKESGGKASKALEETFFGVREKSIILICVCVCVCVCVGQNLSNCTLNMCCLLLSIIPQ